jgi:hypothetical protein
MSRNNIWYWTLAVSALIGAGPGRVWAQEDVDVSINTSSLAGESGSELFVELTGGGSDSGVGYNTVTLSGFNLSGGTAGAVDPLSTFGNVTGNLTSTVSINDNASPFNLSAQFLTPGSQLSFDMDLTGNVNTGPVPDALFLFLYDPSGNPIATTSDPSGFDSLLAVNFNSAAAPISNYDTALVSVAPVVTSSVPEIDPSSALSGLTLLAGALAMLRGRREIKRS